MMIFAATALPLGLSSLLDPAALLQGLGPASLAIVALVVFIESGVLFPFLPGDSLLFTAGLLHRQLNLSLPLLIGVISVAAIAGDQVGYFLGHRFGRRWFKDEARILKSAYLVKTENFFAKQGAKAVVLARFVPVVRTFAPLSAGIARYDYKKFTLWNIVGAVSWAVSVVLLGSWLGHFEIVAKNIDVIAVGIVLISVLPGGIGMIRSRREAVRAAKAPASQNGGHVHQ